MLLYAELQTVIFGRMNTDNALLSNQISVNHFADTPFWHDALNTVIGVFKKQKYRTVKNIL
jgi:hypothetical protein